MIKNRVCQKSSKLLFVLLIAFTEISARGDHSIDHIGACRGELIVYVPQDISDLIVSGRDQIPKQQALIVGGEIHMHIQTQICVVDHPVGCGVQSLDHLRRHSKVRAVIQNVNRLKRVVAVGAVARLLGGILRKRREANTERSVRQIGKV